MIVLSVYRNVSPQHIVLTCAQRPSVCLLVYCTHFVCMATHTCSKSMGQPGKVANPACGQLNRESIFPCPLSRLRIWSLRETGSAVPSRVSLLISIPRLNLVLTYGIPPEFRGGVHYLFKTATRHRASPKFIGSSNCVLMAFTAESPSAQGQ